MVGCINVYGPREQKERLVLWHKLERLCAWEEVKWAIFGDFNEVRSVQERMNSTTNPRGTIEFNDFILRSKLLEIPLGGQKYTRVSDDGFW